MISLGHGPPVLHNMLKLQQTVPPAPPRPAAQLLPLFPSLWCVLPVDLLQGVTFGVGKLALLDADVSVGAAVCAEQHRHALKQRALAASCTTATQLNSSAACCPPPTPAAYGTGMLRAKAIAPPHLRSTTTACFFALYYVSDASWLARLNEAC